MFGTLIDYWDLTRDESYNAITVQAMAHQGGDYGDFMPENQTLQMGNDDQGFWAMSAMSAAERAFPDPPEDKPGWLALAQACFNEWVNRWEDEHCGGGMRWQIFPFNEGFDYKNTISNGCFFNIAARLARYTGNETYANWAEKIYDWQVSTGMIPTEGDTEGDVYDGRHALEGGGCGNIDKIQWSYNAGIYLHGLANLYNFTEDDVWRSRSESIWGNVQTTFFKNEILYEQFCEENDICNQDQRTFKGYLLRWMAAVTQLIPEMYDEMMPLIEKAAVAAITTCTGPAGEDFKGHDGTGCGYTWLTGGTYDGRVGVATQMNALDAVMYTLMAEVKAPVTADDGGTSKGNPDGGVSDDSRLPQARPITTADRAGAGIVTALMILGMVGFSGYLIVDGKF